MESHKKRLVLLLVLVGNIASMATVTSMIVPPPPFFEEMKKHIEMQQRRAKIKRRVVFISAVTAAVVLTAYLFDKYGMEQLGKESLFSDKVDEFLGTIVAELKDLVNKVRDEKSTQQKDVVEAANSAINDMVDSTKVRFQKLNDARKEAGLTFAWVKEKWENLPKSEDSDYRAPLGFLN